MDIEIYDVSDYLNNIKTNFLDTLAGIDVCPRVGEAIKIKQGLYTVEKIEHHFSQDNDPNGQKIMLFVKPYN